MKKILIANRGEISVRIARACADSGYKSVAIASDADRGSLHARLADECHTLSGNSPRETYLNQKAVLEIAKRSGADAIHPGYGLLSENDEFAAAVESCGLVWIGPPASAIRQLGDKVAAREIARKVDAPLLPSYEAESLSATDVRDFVVKVGLPVIIKAQNGGGGRGMRIVRDIVDVEPQLAAAQREAGIAFGRSECFVERYIEHARHIETQCLADSHGNVAVISTRDCTLQRRHQKLIEEAPAPFLSESQVQELRRTSTDILKNCGYRGAATCEFLLTSDGQLYFLEVNTRIQVEHPVTEEVSGTDLIHEMFRIAEGQKLQDIYPPTRGHSIEFRINAENPWEDFRPTPGKIKKMTLPGGPGIRLDFGYVSGDEIPPYYDSMIGKLIVTGASRNEAIARSRRAIRELVIEGINTIADLHREILAHEDFTSVDQHGFKVHTRWIDDKIVQLGHDAATKSEANSLNSASASDHGTSKQNSDPTESSVDDAASEKLHVQYRFGVSSPLSGIVIELCVKEGDNVNAGDTVAVMEAMKMEAPVVSASSGKVTKLNVQQGDFIEMDADILGLD